MKTRKFLTLIGIISIPWLLQGQATRPSALPTDPLPQGDTLEAVAPSVPGTGAQTAPPGSAQAAPDASPAGGILLNFKGAPLSDVLNYLSQAAGFVIVQDVPVEGTVNVISRQPLTADEAVDLLNTVLIEKNFIALRSGRILKIVSRTDAQKLDLPVITGADPSAIPRKDTVVTQILPVRYADVSKLIDNLRPLLSDEASISANDASNAIILTDTQTNVRRIAEIIRALDTSISGISTMHVFPLQYADAKELADVLTQLFQPTAGANGSRQGAGGGAGGGVGGGGFPGFFGRRGGGEGGGGGDNAEPTSEARSAASRVVAVADEQSNSVIVSAPDEYMATISEVVSRLDTSINDVTETRIFHLLHADATEMANILTSLYSDNSTTSQTTGNNRQGQQSRFGGGGGPFGGGFGGGQQNEAATGQPSTRALLAARVVAVPDPRTNSIIVTSSHDSMEEIALTVGRLDASDSKKQHVRIYTLQNADPDNVAAILRGMFSTNGSSSTDTQATDVLTQRTATGASSDVVNTLDTSGNTGSGSRSNGR